MAVRGWDASMKQVEILVAIKQNNLMILIILS